MVDRRDSRAGPDALGTLLRTHRRAALLTQEQLADRAGIAIRTVRNLESGRVRRPQRESVRLIAAALGLGGRQRAEFEDAARAAGDRSAGAYPAPRAPVAAAASPHSRPTGTAPPEPVIGCQLPPDAADFSGREREVSQLGAALAGRDPTSAVSVLTGPPGVGKTSVAVHVAHRVRPLFPDGQLYVDLRGAQRQPLEPAEVLARFLRALGVAGSAVPAGLADRTAMFRARLAGRRVLVVLDDAGSQDQVAPLLPTVPGCAALVTARHRLPGLRPGADVPPATRSAAVPPSLLRTPQVPPGTQVGGGPERANVLPRRPGDGDEGSAVRELDAVREMELDVLDAGAATRLLALVVGAGRVAAEPAAAAAVVERCGGLPLALRIAAARLAARPHWRVGRLADLLADEHRRLDELAGGDLAVRACLTSSLPGLPAPARRALGLLAVLDLPDLPGWLLAAVLDDADAGSSVDALCDAYLLQPFPGPDGGTRYRFHDLVRSLARELAVAEIDPADRRATLARTAATLLAAAEEADRWLDAPLTHGRRRGAAPRRPPDPLALAHLLADPARWLDTERAVLLAAVRQADAAGLDEPCWELAAILGGYYEVNHWVDEWDQALRSGLAAAARASDPAARSMLMRSRGSMLINLGRFEEAAAELRQASRLAGAAGDNSGRAWADYSLASALLMRGLLREATAALQAAEGRFRVLADRLGLAHTLFGLGTVRSVAGDRPGALRILERALAELRALDDRHALPHLLRWVGELRAQTGDPRGAELALREGMDRLRRLGDPLGTAYGLHALGELAIGQGRTEPGRELLDESLREFVTLQNPGGQALVLRSLGRLELARGDVDEAFGHLHRSARLGRELGAPVAEARSLLVLGDLHRLERDEPRARAAWRRALVLLHDLDVPERAEVRDRLAADEPARPGPATGMPRTTSDPARNR